MANASTGRWCTACGTQVATFTSGPGGRPEASCPKCRSLERHRFLCALLEGLGPYVATARTVVDVAPSPQVSPLLQRLVRGRYIRLDFAPAADSREVDVQASITSLPLQDATVDLLLCYHVLEHVPDDRAAMAEIRRVLSPGGLALVQVPWRRGAETDEDPSADPAERLRRFGQVDHVRYYGRDFEDRLLDAGLDFVRITPRDVVGEQLAQRWRLLASEDVWLVRVRDERAHALSGATAADGSLRMRSLSDLAAALVSVTEDLSAAAEVAAAQAEAGEAQRSVRDTAPVEAALALRDAVEAAVAWRLRRARRAARPVTRRLRRRLAGVTGRSPRPRPAQRPTPPAQPTPTAQPPLTAQPTPTAQPTQRPSPQPAQKGPAMARQPAPAQVHDPASGPAPVKVAERVRIFDSVLGMFPPGRLIDLGAGHGMFSRRAADAGWEVTAVDSRAERWQEDPRITWTQKDVRDVDLGGYDVILCLGLFYHLTLADQLDLLERATAPTLILDTHVDTGRSRHPLSERVTHSGFEGRVYQEPDTLLASWGNPQSFWATPDSLYRMLADAGYPLVMPVMPWYLPDRTFFVARRG